MHKVKFNTNQEYEYITNFKVLQACFTQHGIDKVPSIASSGHLISRSPVSLFRWTVW